MAAIGKADQRLLAQLSQLALCNPFTPERLKLEKAVLGNRFQPEEMIAWSRSHSLTESERPNVTELASISRAVIRRVQLAVAAGKSINEQTVRHYWNVATYVLLYRHVVPIAPEKIAQPKSIAKVWQAFEGDYRELVNLPGLTANHRQTAEQLFSFLCQIHRAFYNIFTFILGDSMPSAQLRASVWQSIFTSDLERYRGGLFACMSDLPSLITGPSGTGKELVARAIGLSQFVAFDPVKKCFPEFGPGLFSPLNLSAMSANLIESELFGHRKGSFTGAVADRKGWLELCQPSGAVFLDEIGELDPAIQVKLLRVVQQRTFSRTGETTERRFVGKLIGATNRNLGDEMKAGRFREDLYYRLCADRIETPSLRQQLDDRPDDLHSLVRHLAKRIAGDYSESLADQATEWIQANLGPGYPWRGNIRELEQCISSIMIRNEYLPVESMATAQHSVTGQWTADAVEGRLTADQLLRRYCTWLYHHTGGYEAAAKVLDIDRRTVKAKIIEPMLQSLRSD